MYRKETFPETRDDPLWEKQDGVYIRVLDRTETRLKIPQVTDARGGLLCEDMGTGKTAIVIALILKTKGTWANQPEGSEICNVFEKKSLQDLCKEWIQSHGVNYFQEGIPKQLKEEIYNLPFPYYVITSNQKSGRRSLTQRKVYLSKTTLIIVPLTICDQWQYEFSKYVENGALSIFVKKNAEPWPPVEKLLQYDVVLVTHSQMRSENIVTCESCLGVSSSPLSQIHWLRIVVDEGHVIGKLFLQSLIIFFRKDKNKSNDTCKYVTRGSKMGSHGNSDTQLCY